MIYDQNKTSTDTMVAEFNKLNENSKFTLGKEHNNCMNFLDITINRNESYFEYSVYRKPTTTAHIIYSKSCHSTEHKIMAIQYFVHRLITYPISERAWKIETETITHILQENEYHTYNINAMKQKIQRTSQKQK
jgi:hypothetical protein